MSKRIRLCPTCGDVIRPSFGKVGHVVIPPSAAGGTIDGQPFGEVIGHDGAWEIVRITEPHLYHWAIRAGGRSVDGVSECGKCGVVSVVSQRHKLTKQEEGGLTQYCACGEVLVFWPSIFSI